MNRKSLIALDLFNQALTTPARPQVPSALRVRRVKSDFEKILSPQV
jgi:hypothetical protein